MVSYGKDKEVFVSVLAAAFACFIAMVSSFLPGWRRGGGSQNLLKGNYAAVNDWIPLSFSRRDYGLIQIRGSYSQTLGVLTSTTCETAWVGATSKALQTAFGGDECPSGHAGDCFFGLDLMINNRCVNYQLMMIVSYVTLCFTFLATMMVIGATMCAFLTKTKVTGSIVVGLYIFATVTMLASNVAYAVVSHIAFTDLGENQTYPYPPLSYAYYLHVFAILVLMVATGVFYWKVMPKVRSYCPEEEKRIKRERRMNKFKRNRPQGDCSREQSQTPSPFCVIPPQPQRQASSQSMTASTSQSHAGHPGGAYAHWMGDQRDPRYPESYGAPHRTASSNSLAAYQTSHPGGAPNGGNMQYHTVHRTVVMHGYPEPLSAAPANMMSQGHLVPGQHATPMRQNSARFLEEGPRHGHGHSMPTPSNAAGYPKSLG